MKKELKKCIKEEIRKHLKKKHNFPDCHPQVLMDEAAPLYRLLREKGLIPKIPFQDFIDDIGRGWGIAQHRERNIVYVDPETFKRMEEEDLFTD